MKAVIIERFGGPEVMEYRDVPTPECGPDDVLVEVHAVTVNRALDIHVRETGDAATRAAAGARRRPDRDHRCCRRQRSAIAYRRTRRGHLTTALRHLHACKNGNPADCITPVHLGIHRWGGYAEYVRVPAENTTPIPDNLAFPEASVIFRHFRRHFIYSNAKPDSPRARPC